MLSLLIRVTRVCFGLILVLSPDFSFATASSAEIRKGRQDYAADAKCFGVITQTESLRSSSRRYKTLHQDYTAALFMDAVPFNICIKAVIVERDLMQAGPLYAQTVKSYPASDRAKIGQRDYNFCFSKQHVEHVVAQVWEMKAMEDQ